MLLIFWKGEFYCHIVLINISPEKWMVGILISFWDGLFSANMLNFGSVFFIPHMFYPRQHFNKGTFMKVTLDE